MKQRTKLGAVLALFVCMTIGTASIYTTGCQKHITVTNLPPGVTQTQVTNWFAAEGALQTIAQSTSALRQSVIAVHGIANTPLPDGPLYMGFLQSIGKIDQAQIAAANFLNGVPRTWGTSISTQIAGWANGILDAAKSMVNSGAASIKNPNSQKQMSDFLTDIQDAAQLLVTLSTSASATPTS